MIFIKLESMALGTPEPSISKGLKRFENIFLPLLLLRLLWFMLARRNSFRLKLHKLTCFPFRLFSLFFPFSRSRAFVHEIRWCCVFKTHAAFAVWLFLETSFLTHTSWCARTTVFVCVHAERSKRSKK